MPKNTKIIPRDISWLAFNARVLQEAADNTVPLKERIKFLGIFSNNLDEFFRVRVAALKRMMKFGATDTMHVEESPQEILDAIQLIVLQHQSEFARIWQSILLELGKEKIHLVNEKELSREQIDFVNNFFDEESKALNKQVADHLLDIGEYPIPENIDRVALAAMMQVVNTIYNMEEAITKS